MNKLLLLTFVFTLILGASSAQIKDIELIVGPNLSMIRSNRVNAIFETKPNFDAKISFTTGVGSNYYFNGHDKFSIGAQVLYQNTKVYGDFPFEWSYYRGTMPLTNTFENISIPIRARYSIGRKVKFTGEFGGFVNYLIHVTASDYHVFDESQTSNYEAINEMNSIFAKASEDSYTRFDAGLSLGFSAEVSLSEKLSFKLSASDNYGLANICALDFDFRPINKPSYMKSNTMNLLAGVVYSLH